MTVLYKLAAEQLSKQHHYDFGLRALKSVLVMAGALKRGSPGMSEQLVLMRALRDMNLPKFVYDDVPLFLGLVRGAGAVLKLSCRRLQPPALTHATTHVDGWVCACFYASGVTDMRSILICASGPRHQEFCPIAGLCGQGSRSFAAMATPGESPSLDGSRSGRPQDALTTAILI
jgi:hypothetical protein